MHDVGEEGKDGTTGVRRIREEGEKMVDGENKNMNGVDKYVSAVLVKKMLGLIQASIDDGDGYDQREWLNFVEQMPTVVPGWCKDCKHFRLSETRAFGLPVRKCEYWGFEDMDENEFCSRGEREEREGNG